MVMRHGVGASVNIVGDVAAKLFAETPGQVIIATSRGAEVEKLASKYGVAIVRVGQSGGDSLEIDVSVGKKCHAVLSTPSATKWYKSFKNPATQCIQFELDEDAKLDWLPQENLFFKGANSNVVTKLNLTSSSSYIGWDALMLGRNASGEKWDSGHIHLLSEIKRDGKLIWVENGNLDAQDAYLNSLPQLGNWPICATLIAMGPRCSSDLVEQFSEMMLWNDQLRAGITFLPQGILVMRAVSSDMEVAKIGRAHV